MIRRLVIASLGCVLCLAAASLAFGEDPPPQNRLLVAVLDQTNSVLPTALVTATGEEAGNASVTVEGRASGSGTAVLAGLLPGRYTVRVEFPGFQTAVLQGVRVRPGDNRRSITLALQKHDEDVTVSRDHQSASVDPRGSAFSSVLTREQIDALPDDPDEMEEALKAMAPPGSTIRVDGFTGGKLPPKSQIRSIRLPRMDMFAAQNHGGMNGALFIDIMTMPGAGPLRGSVEFNFLNDALNARNAMTASKGDEQLRQVGFSLSGTITPNRTSFSMSASAASQYFSSNVYALVAGGQLFSTPVRQPQDRWNVSARVEHALTKDHAVRLSFERTDMEQRNLGVGDFNLPERSYRSTSTANIVRVSENGPLGRRFFSESRLQVGWSDTATRADVEGVTFRVNDAFTAGGAQTRGGRRDLAFELASDLDYVRGSHSWRTGLLLEGGRYTSDDLTNYLGTYTFASLEDYATGRAASYTRRVGDPAVSYGQLTAAAYVQDDWRVARSLLVSAGVRFGRENLAGGWNVSPRLSAAWSPFRNGALTFRGSYGGFYDWIAGDVYKQTRLVDGSRLREVSLVAPSYPDPGALTASVPSNRYLWSDALVLPHARRVSVGVDRALTPDSRLSVTYNYTAGTSLLRPRNLNAAVGGVRPDPAFAAVAELVSDAASRQHALNIGWSLTRLNWHRLFAYANYTLGSSRTNTAGAFTLLPGADDLAGEWGPAGGDVHHRLSAFVSAQPTANLGVSLTLTARSGSPYTVTTGRDDNGDGVFSDRPAGTPRNSARGAGSVEVSGRVSYGWNFGPPRQASAGGAQVVAIRSDAGGLPSGFGGGTSDRRYRIECYLAGQNLLNRTNYLSYSGVLTSPVFGQPTAAGSPRRMQMGVRFAF